MITSTIEKSWKSRLRQMRPYVGNTPLYPIANLWRHDRVMLSAKLEWQQIGGSVKARPAFQIIHDAIANNELLPGQTLLDASSGNTAIAYAAIGARLELPVEICLPQNASQTRKNLLKAYGARVTLTSAQGGTDEAQHVARELKRLNPESYYYADQYNNPSNWRSHYLSTAEEIWTQTQGRITHLVIGLGTTGSFTGIGRRLRELKPDIRLIALQPETALHGLEGWKHLETAIMPGIFDATLADEVIVVESEHALEMMLRGSREEGLWLSPSAAANLAGAIKVASRLDQGTVVTLLPDDGSKYEEVYESLLS